MQQVSQIWRLSSGNVVVTEGGVTRVLTPPVGVHYCIQTRRWVAFIADGETDWTRAYFPIQTVGVVKAMEQAVACRELSISYLLNVRLLPRVRRGYTVREVNGLFAVYDPLSKCRRYFSTKDHAVAYNIQAVADWVKANTFDRRKMITIRTQLPLDFTIGASA